MINLNLSFTRYPIGTAKRRALLFFCFEESLRNPDEKWGFNSRTSKYLRSLWIRNFWTGEEGEILLVSCKDLGNAEWILLMGLGKRALFNEEIFQDRLREAGKTLRRLRIDDFGLYLPVINEFEEECLSHFLKSLTSVIKAFELECDSGLSQNLWITVSIEDEIMKIMKSGMLHFERELEKTVDGFNYEFQGDEVFLNSARM